MQAPRWDAVAETHSTTRLRIGFGKVGSYIRVVPLAILEIGGLGVIIYVYTYVLGRLRVVQ